MKKFVLIYLTIALSPLVTSAAGALPEFGFCPLGGPPGWFNRFTNQQKYRYGVRSPAFPIAGNYPGSLPVAAMQQYPMFNSYTLPGPSIPSPSGWYPAYAAPYR